MRRISRFLKWGGTMTATWLLAMSVRSVAADPVPEAVAGTWQHHQDTFYYYGLTALFSCTSIEDHVKQILLYLGARKDAYVSANGCPGGFDTPGHSANVHADFYTLAPAEAAGAPGTIKAQWMPVEMTPKHPFFIGDGDCELIKSMQDFLPKNFSLRDVRFTTDCVPYELTPNGFSVKAAVLKALPAVKVTGLRP